MRDTSVVPEAVINNVQAYPNPKNVEEVQAFEGFGFGRTFIPHLAQCICPLYCLLPGKERAHRGSEQQAAFEKAKILVKQIKALGISKAGLQFELNVPMTPEGIGGALWQKQQKESESLGFWSQLWKGAEN